MEAQRRRGAAGVDAAGNRAVVFLTLKKVPRPSGRGCDVEAALAPPSSRASCPPSRPSRRLLRRSGPRGRCLRGAARRYAVRRSLCRRRRRDDDGQPRSRRRGAGRAAAGGPPCSALRSAATQASAPRARRAIRSAPPRRPVQALLGPGALRRALRIATSLGFLKPVGMLGRNPAPLHSPPRKCRTRKICWLAAVGGA